MLKIYLLLILLSISTSTFAEEKKKFVEIFSTKSNCSTSHKSKSICSCVANIWYDSLSDKEKGYVMIGMDLMEGNPEMSRQDIIDYIDSTLENPDLEIAALSKKWEDLKPKLKEQCNYEDI